MANPPLKRLETIVAFGCRARKYSTCSTCLIQKECGNLADMSQNLADRILTDSIFFDFQTELKNLAEKYLRIYHWKNINNTK